MNNFSFILKNKKEIIIMWLKFESIEKKNDLVSKKTGTTYSAYIVKGIKRGFQEEPDQPWEKIFFDGSVTTTIEHGIPRNNQSVVGFFTKAVKPGDTVVIKHERAKGRQGWDVVSLEKAGDMQQDSTVTYEPLTEEQALQIKNGSTIHQMTGSESAPWLK